MTEEEILQGATIIAHKVADDNVSIVFILPKRKIKRINFFLDGCFT
jgi:hypothetical protein